MRRPEGCSVTGRCGILKGRRSGEVGAGIQLAPHATRVLRRLDRLDLLDAVAARAAHPAQVSFRSWSDGAEICRHALGHEAEDVFGAPYLQLHRADLHQVPADGERLGADLVVAAGEDFHLPDGPEAEARDARIAAHAAGHRFMPRARTWTQ
ncbi:hypothetical protein ABZ725_06935 [Streptomyces sp. NPDC006872]|uniref:hypothetical protein n=1 Tax=Streptomyces sp. NPDC006872 TaxID=3155720 RepID=UPI0033D578EC